MATKPAKPVFDLHTIPKENHIEWKKKHHVKKQSIDIVQQAPWIQWLWGGGDVKIINTVSDIPWVDIKQQLRDVT